MTIIEESRVDVPPRIREAIDGLESTIVERFPQATFVVQEREDPPGFSLVATVDIDDTDEVTELIIDRLIDLQVYDELPLYFVPLRPIERVFEAMRRRAETDAPWLRPYVDLADAKRAG